MKGSSPATETETPKPKLDALRRLLAKQEATKATATASAAPQAQSDEVAGEEAEAEEEEEDLPEVEVVALDFTDDVFGAEKLDKAGVRLLCALDFFLFYPLLPTHSISIRG